LTDRLIRITTALAVVAVAVVAAVISYQHAFELVRSHGESGLTARLLPFTVDGLIWAASMVVPDASRRGQPVPRLARGAWAPGSWPRSAPTWHMAWDLLIRAGRNVQSDHAGPELRYQAAPPLAQDAPLELPVAPALEQTVRERHQAGHSQRAIARELNLDRRRVKRILDQAT
jgi:Protein of unknown function (DUF2637)